jgi:hypothetical protein
MCRTDLMFTFRDLAEEQNAGVKSVQRINFLRPLVCKHDENVGLESNRYREW